MKKMYLSPYIDTSGQSQLFSEMYKRKLLANPSENYCFICKFSGHNYYEAIPFSYLYYKLPQVKYSSLDEATTALDKLLLDEGYIFLTQNQWDNLQLLI